MTTRRYPRAEWKPLPEHDQQSIIKPTQAIIHSIVGSAKGCFNYFRDSTNIESHLILPYQGVPWQIMDLDRRGDANYKANRRPDGTGAHSMETEDNRDPDNDPWTPSQVDEIIAWLRWEIETFDIPRRVCRTPDDPGFGYHSMFGAPSPWTSSRGKTCPGHIRIKQFNDIIVPAVLAPNEQEDEDDMSAYRSAEEARPFVENAYLRIAGRPVESEKTRETWVYVCVVDPKGANELMTALQNERRMREDNQAAAFSKRLADLEGRTYDGPEPLDEDALMERIADRLTNG